MSPRITALGRFVIAFACLLTFVPVVAYAQTCPQPTIVTDPDVCAGSTGYANAAPPPSGTTYETFVWSIVNGTIPTPSNSASVTFFATGEGAVQLTLTVTDSTGCQATNSATIPLATLPPPQIDLYEPSVCPGSTTIGGYAMTAPPPSGITYDTFQWSIVNGTITYGATSSSASFTVDGSAPAELTLTVTDTRGCQSSSTIEVPIRTIPPPQIELYEPSICPGSSALGGYAMTAPPPAGVTYSAFQWSIVNGTITYGATNSSMSFTSTGTDPVELTLTVQDDRGCTSTSSITVPIRTIPPPQIELYEPSICPGSSALGGYAMTAPPPAGVTYSAFQWSIVNGTITYGATNSSMSFTSTGTDPVVLTLTVRDDRGCTSTNSVTVPIRTIPPPQIELYEPGICPGSSALGGYAMTAPPPAGVTYSAFQWSIVNGTITYGATNSSVSFTANGNVAPVLTLTVHDNRGCISTNSVTVPIRVLPPPEIELQGAGLCPGGSAYAAVAPPPAGITYSAYQWAIVNGTITTGDTGSSISFTASGSAPVELTLTVHDNRGCTATKTMTVPFGAVPPIYVNNPNDCSTNMNSASLAMGAYNDITWTVTNGTILSGQGTFYLEFTGNGNGAVTVSVEATAVGGTCAGTNSVVIPGDVPPAELYVPDAVCPGVLMKVVGSAFYGNHSFNWTITNATIEGPANERELYFRADGTGPVTASATAVTYWGCPTSNSVTIPLGSTIQQPEIAANLEQVCSGGGVNVYLYEPDDIYGTYQWAVTNATVTYDGGHYLSLQHQPGTGDISVSLTVGEGACTSTATRVIDVIETVEPIIELDTTPVCPNGTRILYWDNYDSFSYHYFNILNGHVLSTQPGRVAGGRTITIKANGGGNVTVDLYGYTGGCYRTRNLQIPLIPAAATITASGTTNLCEGGSVTLTANSGSGYLWSNGATTQSITISQAGTYTVTVSQTNGCSNTASRTVTVRALPGDTITASGPTTFCQGGSVTLTAPLGSTYLWSNGATTRTINVSTSGTYTVTVTANSCTRTSNPITVTANAIPAATITPSGPTTFCAGGSVTLTASAGASYSWSNGATTQSITVSDAGNYSVTVSSAAGCSATSSATAVTVNANSPANITASGPTTFCEGGSVTLTALAGASYLWSNGATTQSIDVTASGNYSVVVTSAAGCSTTSSATTVTVNPTPVVAITPSGPTTFCEGGSVTLTATEGASYLWSSGENTRSITVSDSGNYSVTVTNESGCSASSAPTNVTVNELATAEITASGATTFCEGGSVTLTASEGASYLWSNGATTRSIDATTSGGYSVTVTNAGGCSATSSATTVTVNTNPVASITASGPTTFCEGGSVTLTASAGASYLWSNGATTQSINVSASGSYSVVVTNAAGCSTTSSATAVTVNANPVASITASGPTTFCEGGSVTLTASAGTSYLWSNGATTQSITVSAAGSYSVTVSSAAGCSTTSSATAVTVNANPVASITASGATTFCEGGSVTLTASAGASYLWSNGATTQSIDVAASGSYSVVVTNAAGCSTTSSATAVTVNPTPVVAITPSGATTFCEGGSVTLTATDGASYLWSSGETTRSITVSDSGNYSVTVTTASGCSASSAPTNVTVNELAIAEITASGATTFCAGGSVTLTATEGASYLWSNGAITRSINATTAGDYSVTVTTAAGCSTTSSATAVTVNANPVASISASGPTTFCEGGSVTLTASAGSSWSWSNGATTQSITVTTSGSYSVAVTNAAGCTATSSAATVTVNPLPTPSISASGPTTFCEGGSVTLTGVGGAGTWYRNGVGYSGATSITITAVGSATFVRRMTTAAGCTADSEPVTVTVNPKPFIGNTSGVSAACWNTTSWHQVNDGPPGATFVWTATNATIASGANDYRVYYTPATGATTVGLDVVMTTTAGCSVTKHFDIPVDRATPTIAPSGPTTFCVGGSVTLTMPPAPAGGVYIWSNNATTQSITVSSSGTYTARYRFAGGCIGPASDPVTVTVNPLPTATITNSGSTTFCEGGSVTLTASAGASYLWSNGQTSQSIDAMTSGNYSVTVTNENGCSKTSPATVVTVNPAPVATITATGDTTFCTGGSVTLTASAGSSYLWSTGAITQSINATIGGNYSVTVTNAAGCSTTSAETVVTVNAAATPTITESGPLAFCEGGSVTLTASAGSSYLWSTGATAPSINVTAAGSYTVTVTDANGCSAISAPKVVTVNAPPVATISTSGSPSFCQGGSVTLTASAGSSYLWSTGETTPSINVTTAGNYSVTVTNANGCSATSADTTITVNTAATPTISESGPTTFCAGGSVTLTASAGSSYLWSTGQTTPSITVTSADNYTVTVTDANGCSATSAPKTVIVNTATTPTITESGATTFCQGGSVTLTASAGVSYLWSTGQTTPSITVTSSNNYTVTVTDANGCSATSAPKSVTVNPLPVAAISPAGPVSFCTGGTVRLTASAGASYLWSNGSTDSYIDVTVGGNYSVIVTNANGCSATSPVKTVTENANPATPTVTASGPTTFCAGGSVTLSAPAGAGYSYLWSNGAITPSINVNTTGNYSVIVTNASGCSATSAPKSVTVNAATSITAQPQNKTIARNTTTQLSVTAAGTGPFTYQWYRGTSPNTAQPISGATISTYTTPKLGRGTYTYWVRVTGACGVVNSTTATVNVP